MSNVIDAYITIRNKIPATISTSILFTSKIKIPIEVLFHGGFWLIFVYI